MYHIIYVKAEVTGITEHGHGTDPFIQAKGWHPGDGDYINADTEAHGLVHVPCSNIKLIVVKEVLP